MASDDALPGSQPDELAELIRGIRDKVRATAPGGASQGVALPDLSPLLHARDRLEAKVAAIGMVNPRPPGVRNALIQAAKKLVSRLLDWHVREQVEFNRAAAAAITAAVEALNVNNQALARLGALQAELRTGIAGVQSELKGEIAQMAEEARQLKDIRNHWAQWRQEWEHKLAVNEVQFLRSVADLQGSFQHRVSLMEANLRELTRTQHADFTLALERAGQEIQKRMWADLERARMDFERLVHLELRLIRQRAGQPPAAAAPAGPMPAAAPAAIDFMWFAERFRGPEERVRLHQTFYVDFFRGCRSVVDLGCGRGEFLELLREAGIGARGVDSSQECVSLCRAKKLEAEQGDLFVCLAGAADGVLDGVFAAQVVEHLPPERVPELVSLAASKLVRGGILLIETPNPACLAVFASYFYQDPTHRRPVPADLLRFYLEESGLGEIAVHYRSPAVESFPALASLPEDFRGAFFGSLDYAILGRKL